MKSNKPILSTIVFTVIIIFIALPVVMLPFADFFKISFSADRFKSDELYDISFNVIKELESNNLDLTFKLLEKQTENPEQGISQLTHYFQNNPLHKFYLIGATKNIQRKDGSSEIIQGFDFQLENENSFGVLSMALLKNNNDISMTHLMLQPMESTMAEHNKFYKNPFGLERILLVMLFLLSAGFVIFTVSHYFTHSQEPKIHFILLLSLSVGLFSIEWNSLNVNMELFALGLSPSQIFRPGNVGVWKMNFYVPLFSIFYWAGFRKKFLQNPKNELTLDQESEIDLDSQ